MYDEIYHESHIRGTSVVAQRSEKRESRDERVEKRMIGARTRVKRVSFATKVESKFKSPSLIKNHVNPFTSPMMTDESEEMIETRRIVSSGFRRDAI